MIRYDDHFSLDREVIYTSVKYNIILNNAFFVTIKASIKIYYTTVSGAIIPEVGLGVHVMRTAVTGHVTSRVTWSHEHGLVPEV